MQRTGSTSLVIASSFTYHKKRIPDCCNYPKIRTAWFKHALMHPIQQIDWHTVSRSVDFDKELSDLGLLFALTCLSKYFTIVAYVK